MITINEGILTLSGIMFLKIETTIFDITRTNVVANPIPRPLIAVVVTPSVGQSPRSRTNTGLSLIKPFVKFVIDS